MFSLENATAKINSVTNIAEMNGPERVPAVSIGFTVTGPSTLLNQFDSRLRTLLYQAPEQKKDGLQLDDENLVERCFPLMGALKWSAEYAGYQLLFVIGTSTKEDVLLNNVDLKDFAFQPLEGGSIKLSFKAHAQPDNEVDHGKIARRLQQEVTITLTEPEAAPDLLDALTEFKATKPKRGNKGGDQFKGTEFAGGVQ